MASTVAGSTVPKMRSAVRKLCQHGAEAMKPQLVDDTYHHTKRWHPPQVNKRVSAILRKQAIREGSYGSFDPVTGKGWDPNWDIELATLSKTSGRYRLKPPKKNKRERNREQRAQKIEKNLEDMDKNIEEYYVAKASLKPTKNFQYYFKKLDSSANRRGG